MTPTVLFILRCICSTALLLMYFSKSKECVRYKERADMYNEEYKKLKSTYDVLVETNDGLKNQLKNKCAGCTEKDVIRLDTSFYETNILKAEMIVTGEQRIILGEHLEEFVKEELLKKLIHKAEEYVEWYEEYALIYGETRYSGRLSVNKKEG